MTGIDPGSYAAKGRIRVEFEHRRQIYVVSLDWAEGHQDVLRVPEKLYRRLYDRPVHGAVQTFVRLRYQDPLGEWRDLAEEMDR